jgi:hypothetical protein
MVLVNHYAYASTAPIFKASYHSAAAVDLHIATGTQNFGRKQNGEIHHRTDWNVFVHRKQHAVR